MVTSGETRLTTPFNSGVARWLKAESRSSVFWPICSLSISCGLTLASTCRSSAFGTIIMMGSPAGITPPPRCNRGRSTHPAPQGSHGGLHPHPILRSADCAPPQLIFGSDLALDEFADLVVGLTQVL